MTVPAEANATDTRSKIVGAVMFSLGSEPAAVVLPLVEAVHFDGAAVLPLPSGDAAKEVHGVPLHIDTHDDQLVGGPVGVTEHIASENEALAVHLAHRESLRVGGQAWPVR